MAVLSAVDTSHLTQNDVRVVVQDTYWVVEVSEQQKVYDQIMCTLKAEREGTLRLEGLAANSSSVDRVVSSANMTDVD